MATLNLVHIIDMSSLVYIWWFLLFTVSEFQSLSAAKSVFAGVEREGLFNGKVLT